MKAWFIFHEKLVKKIAICLVIVFVVSFFALLFVDMIKPNVGQKLTVDGNTYVVTKSPLFGDGECTLLKSENEKIEVPNKINFGSRNCTVKYFYYKCVSEKSVVFPENFDGFAYYDKDNKLVTSSEIYTKLNIKEITVSKDNKKYDSRDNCNCIIETSTNTLLLSATTNVHIPDGVTRVKEKALHKYLIDGGVSKLVLPESLKVLDAYSFGDYLINDVTDLAKGNLNYIDLGNVEHIGEYAFYSSTFSHDEPVTIILPNTIKEIHSTAFIHTGTFATKDAHNIVNAYYKGSKDDFSNINITSGNQLKFSAYDYVTIYYYSNEKVEDTNNKYWHYDSNNEIAIWE